MRNLEELSLTCGEYKLAQNLVDVMKEQQVKLGYQKGKVRLYYPAASLNHLLGTKYEVSELQKFLEEFLVRIQESLGENEVSHNGERFCFLISSEGSEYAHTHLEPDDFLYSLIERMERHGVTIYEILEVFTRQSEHVVFREIEDGEFQYLLYFEDGKPDNYYYCLTEEGGHFSYHRFTKEDYEEFGF